MSFYAPLNAATARQLALWLSLCCLLVFAMVVLGGAVRLSGSGLSMVEWRPLAGIAPPLDAEAWRQAFEKYRQFPEFRLINPDLTPAGFRFIFFMEYAHRLLGRIIALAFLLPFLFFLTRRMVPRELAARLWLVFFLGALQGLLGWHMVRSGLADDPRISQYRLAMHLLLAVALYAYMLCLAIGLRAHASFAGGGGIVTDADGETSGGGGTVTDTDDETTAAGETVTDTGDETVTTADGETTVTIAADTSLRITGAFALTMIFFMIISGAFVAGTHAAQAYPTWPKLGGEWFPPQLFALHPWWINFSENLLTIQFLHRWLAMLTFAAIAAFAWKIFRAGDSKHAAAILLIISAQILLGIITLKMRVPFALGLAHQTGAMILLTITLSASVKHFRK